MKASPPNHESGEPAACRKIKPFQAKSYKVLVKTFNYLTITSSAADHAENKEGFPSILL